MVALVDGVDICLVSKTPNQPGPGSMRSSHSRESNPPVSGALAPCGVNDLCKREAALSGDRPKDFEDVGGLFDDRVGRRRRDKFVDLFAQLVMERGPVCVRRQRRDARPASGGSNNLGDPVPDEFAHAVPFSSR